MELYSLDNAANIYPAIVSRNYAPIYRVETSLMEEVDPAILQEALGKVMPRFPSLQCTLKQGLYWWYLKRTDRIPQVLEYTDIKPFSFKQNGGLMLRVCAGGRRIALDMFHSLTDGTGGITFLLTLTGEYLRLAKGIHPSCNDFVLNPADPPCPEETEDAFERLPRTNGKLDKEHAAYHYRGTEDKEHYCTTVSFGMDGAEVVSVAHAYGCTVTEYLASVMTSAIQDMYEADSSPKSGRHIKISIPVNLRKLTGKRTLRNFSSYVNPGIDMGLGHHSFNEIVQEIRGQKLVLSAPRKMLAKAAGNVGLARNPLVRSIPLLLKKPVLSISNKLLGDRYCSTTLSNLGNIELPEEMRYHVEGLRMMLGRSRGKACSCGLVTTGGRMNLTFSRKIRETGFERRCLELLERDGIKVIVEGDLAPEKAASRPEKRAMPGKILLVLSYVAAVLLGITTLPMWLVYALVIFCMAARTRSRKEFLRAMSM